MINLLVFYGFELIKLVQNSHKYSHRCFRTNFTEILKMIERGFENDWCILLEAFNQLIMD